MKKYLMTGMMGLVLAIAVSACAETTAGKVVKTDGHSVTIRQADGTEATMKTTDTTTYRKKKVVDKHWNENKKPNQSHYKPIIEEDDFIEVIYNPSTGDEWVIEDVVIYDD